MDRRVFSSEYSYGEFQTLLEAGTGLPQAWPDLKHAKIRQLALAIKKIMTIRLEPTDQPQDGQSTLDEHACKRIEMASKADTVMDQLAGVLKRCSLTPA